MLMVTPSQYPLVQNPSQAQVKIMKTLRRKKRGETVKVPIIKTATVLIGGSTLAMADRSCSSMGTIGALYFGTEPYYAVGMVTINDYCVVWQGLVIPTSSIVLKGADIWDRVHLCIFMLVRNFWYGLVLLVVGDAACWIGALKDAVNLVVCEAAGLSGLVLHPLFSGLAGHPYYICLAPIYLHCSTAAVVS